MVYQDETSEVFRRARKNVLFISVVISFLMLAGVELKSLNILGNKIEVSRIIWAYIFIGLIYLYYLYRYCVLLSLVRLKKEFYIPHDDALKMYIMGNHYAEISKVLEEFPENPSAGPRPQNKHINNMKWKLLRKTGDKGENFGIIFPMKDSNDQDGFWSPPFTITISEKRKVKINAIGRYLRSNYFVANIVPLIIAVIPVLIFTAMMVNNLILFIFNGCH